jgi:DNA primase
MEYHKVSFVQALRDLADRYHVTLPKRELTPSQKQNMELRELLFKINGSAAEYYHHVLMKSEKGRPGSLYLDKRSISHEVILEFKLGYAPDEWDALTRYLQGKKVEMEKAALAGLIMPKKDGGYYDRFRGRVIFPILNLRQQIVGFGGRVLDDSLPKYLNTSETPVFHKGELLYGLHASYPPIRESGRAVIVEGYTDVLALRRHGFNESVATLGTALTRDHIRKLKGYAKEAVVVFDADAAGKEAAIKSLPLFLNEGLSSKVMVLPEGDDPDSFINKNGLSGFLDLLSESMPMFDFYLNLKLSHGGDGIEDQVSLLRDIVPVLSELNNTAQRSLYVQRFSEKTGIAESVVLVELRNFAAHQKSKGGKNGIGEKLLASKAKRGDDLPLLNLLIHSPHTMNRLMNHDCKILLSDPIVMEIFDSLFEIYTREGEVAPSEVIGKLAGEPARERFREVMLSPPIYPDGMVEQAVDEFEHRVDDIKITGSINEAKRRGDIEELNRLLKIKSSREDEH